VQILDADTGALEGSSIRNRFVLHERVVVNGFYGLPHEWEQSEPAGTAPRRDLPEPAFKAAV
jgi:hypothetical protein